MFEKRVTETYIQHSLQNKELNRVMYSLYRDSQNSDGSKALISQTLNFYEYLIFSLKSNMIWSTDTRAFDFSKVDKRIEKYYNKIVHIEPDTFEPLLIPKYLYDKLYALVIDKGVSIDKILLYSVWELTRVKNPRPQTSSEEYMYNHVTWLHPETTEIPLTLLEMRIIQLNRERIRVYYALKHIDELMMSYKQPDFLEYKHLGEQLVKIKSELSRIQSMIEKSSEGMLE